MKLSPVSRRKPWRPVLSLNPPTICPASLMPKASVNIAPGTSIWVKLKLAAFAEEQAAIGAMARKATMESIVQQEFNDSVLSDFLSMMVLPLIYNLLNRHSLNSWRSEGGIAPLNDLCKGKPRRRLTTLERTMQVASKAHPEGCCRLPCSTRLFPAVSW